MASKFFADHFIVVIPKFDELDGHWSVDVEITRRFDPPDKFPSKTSAEDFGFQLAEHWIKTRSS